VEFQSSQATQGKKIPPKFDKILGRYTFTSGVNMPLLKYGEALLHDLIGQA
jgi:hypothetical protein